jgi:cyclic beta-1,2-glucan synthetase
MFEYLMPSLVMRAPAGSILDLTTRLAVRGQIEYGRELGVPWGISESLFYARDMDGTYQYAGFGVPDLGYKRGLGENIVIAPYATALAAMVEPAAAAENFQRLTEEGGRGPYGWYEALDYTPSRLPEGSKVAIVRAYMAHHHAMSIVAIADALLEGEMRERFHADAMIKATELLLQERMPRDIPIARPPATKVRAAAVTEHVAPEMQRRFNSPHSRIPRTHLLSNGSYAVMVTGAGSGYSRWHNLDVTRWREDVTCDDWGSYIFLRDCLSGETWSAGYQPTGVEPDYYEASFFEDHAEFVRHDGTLRTTLEISSPEHDPRYAASNNQSRDSYAWIELTSYAELVLGPYGIRDTPAFSKLFVETGVCSDAGTLGDAAPQIARTTRDLGGPPHGDRRRVEREHAIRDRSRVLHGPWAAHSCAAMCDGRMAPLQYRGMRTRPDLQPALPVENSPWRVDTRVVLDDDRGFAAGSARSCR